MTTANHDQMGSRCKAHIDQATRTAPSGRWGHRLCRAASSWKRAFARALSASIVQV